MMSDFARPLCCISSCMYGCNEKLEGSPKYCVCVYDQPGSPDDSRSDFSTKEYAECADSVRGEHADDGEGHREFPVQRVTQNCPEEDKKT